MTFGTERLALQLVNDAVRQEGSDIHLIPKENCLQIQLRVQGDLVQHKTISADAGERLISHFKFKASLDIGEKRKPQSGACDVMIDDESLPLRISTLPSATGRESMVIRLLPQSFAIPIEKLSMFSHSAKKLQELASYPQGLLLFTGPTGSGKSTTLYSLLHFCSTVLKRNVITLEDPVERKEDHVLQVQINERAGVTYSSGLKAILRHDPDIIIVGEIRDMETADIAVKAALSGHLVLSTLHAKNAAGAIRRMIDLGISKEVLLQALIGVTGQRLVKINTVSHSIKRTSIYEIVTSPAIESLIDQIPVRHNYVSLPDLFRKGVALGYVSSEEYHRWMASEIPYSEKRSAAIPVKTE
ncbi:competence type IV pilus ATPase ComGA [Jeotgalibacillus aurantiacus]|uniref:competence type IV pilus ATPase ComGA n=1 Tax=Jeotgalibacillus aurantiacus TaxID=2763266 RepID=UPI001D09CCB2|nr:competence type IV pilus ATPase ComGA [Jeotgalibacillus aurantiacus]